MGEITRTNFGICKTVEFGNAALLQAPVVSPIEILPSIPGLLRFPVLILAVFDWVADLVVDSDSDIVSLHYADTSGANYDFGVNGLFTEGESTFAVLKAPADTTKSALSSFLFGGAVSLAFDNNGANPFTGGAAGNKLTVKFFYDTVNVAIIA